jgi:hypothetical protein
VAAAQTPPHTETGRWLAATLLDEALGLVTPRDRPTVSPHRRRVPRNTSAFRQGIDAVFLPTRTRTDPSAITARAEMTHAEYEENTFHSYSRMRRVSTNRRLRRGA